MENKPVIGIVGLGFVGGALKEWFESEGYDLVTYDLAKPCTGQKSFQIADIVYLCLPTPYRANKCDFGALTATFKWLPKGKKVVIKSTIPPGTTDLLAKGYNGTVFFNPEFLDSSKAVYDFRFPERQIIGYTEGHEKEAQTILDTLPPGNREFIMPAREAECVKYMGNTFFALKNVFANIWYDYCEAEGIDYDMVREAVGAEPRIGYVHMQAKHKGGRGAGGSCLPKDLGATIDFMSEKGVDCDVLKVARKKNDKRLKENGKTDFLGMYEI